MGLHYLIDGYNLIWSADNFGGGKLQDQRERLLKFLEQTRPAGSPVNKVTVVFDGQEDVDGPPWRGSVKVIFSKGEEADHVIKRIVDSMTNARNAVVVTDDRDIQKWVRSSQAKVVGCKEFQKAALRPPRTGASTSSKLNPDDANSINEELKRIWKLG